MNIKNTIKEWWLMLISTILLGFLYFFTSQQTTVLNELSGGLFVEVIGAILTFTLIDRVLKRSEERKRLRMEKAALKSFRFTIVDLLHMFWNMRRAAAQESLAAPPSNWQEAIASDAAIDDIKHLDFLSDAGVHPARTWNIHLADSFEYVHLPAIRRLIDSYAFFLSEELTEKLEALNGSTLFSRMFIQARGLSSIPGRTGHVPMLACMDDYIKSTLKDLLDLADLYNKLCPENSIEFEGLDLSEKSAPLLGTGRIEYVE